MTTQTPDNSAETKKKPAWYWQVFERVLFWAVVFPCAATLLALLASRRHWRFDVLTSFHHIYAIGLLMALMLLALLKPRRKVIMSVAAIGFLMNAAIVAPLYWGGVAVSDSAPSLRIAFLNVLRSNHDDRRIVEWLRGANPDIIIVNELTAHHDALIRREFPDHSFGASLPDEGYYGIGIFSRMPLERARVEFYGDEGEATVLAEASLGGRPLMLASTHLYPPFRHDLAARRNQQSIELAPLLALQPRPLLFAGDLNMTSWSPYFRDLLRSANLRDGRRGYGLRATWPASLPGIGVTIDHALCSDEVAIKSYAVGPNIGSDHRPFVLEVALKNSE